MIHHSPYPFELAGEVPPFEYCISRPWYDECILVSKINVTVINREGTATFPLYRSEDPNSENTICFDREGFEVDIYPYRENQYYGSFKTHTVCSLFQTPLDNKIRWKLGLRTDSTNGHAVFIHNTFKIRVIDHPLFISGARYFTISNTLNYIYEGKWYRTTYDTSPASFGSCGHIGNNLWNDHQSGDIEINGIKVHSLVLTHSGDHFFKSMLLSGMKDSTKTKFTFENADQLEYLLIYLYTGEFMGKDPDLYDLFLLAERFAVTPVLDYINSRLLQCPPETRPDEDTLYRIDTETTDMRITMRVLDHVQDVSKYPRLFAVQQRFNTIK